MREYTVMIGGIPHTVQHSDAEAARQGLTKAAPEPENKAPTRRPRKGHRVSSE